MLRTWMCRSDWGLIWLNALFMKRLTCTLDNSLIELSQKGFRRTTLTALKCILWTSPDMEKWKWTWCQANWYAKSVKRAKLAEIFCSNMLRLCRPLAGLLNFGQNSRNISNLSLLKIFEEEPVWKHVAFPSLHSLHFFAGWINCRAQASWERTNSRWVQERSIEFASNHWTPYSDQDQRFNRRLETKKQEQKLGKDLYLLDDPEINALGKSRIHRDTGYFRNTWRFRHEDGCCTRNCLKFLVI